MSRQRKKQKTRDLCPFSPSFFAHTDREQMRKPIGGLRNRLTIINKQQPVTYAKRPSIRNHCPLVSSRVRYCGRRDYAGYCRYRCLELGHNHADESCSILLIDREYALELRSSGRESAQNPSSPEGI
jgi:hypothetical protein